MICVRFLSLRLIIAAERVAREGGSTRSAYLEVFPLSTFELFLRNRAPAVTATYALSLGETATAEAL
jgi:hypothetical protein